MDKKAKARFCLEELKKHKESDSVIIKDDDVVFIGNWNSTMIASQGMRKAGIAYAVMEASVALRYFEHIINA